MIRYFANRRIKIAKDTFLEVGEEILDWRDWRNIHQLVNLNHVHLREEGEAQPAKPIAPVPPASGGLRAALIEVLADAKTHSRRALIGLANREIDDLPPMPSTKRGTIEALAELVGLKV